MSRKYDYLFKIHLIGDIGVGKTSLLLRFAEEHFAASYISSIGLDFRIKTITFDNKIVKLQIWDIISQRRFRRVYTAYYRETHGFIVVFDVTDRESFDHVPDWLLEIDQFSSLQIPRLLVGNKGDLVNEKVVGYSTSRKYADSLNMPFLETSAKCSTNVEQAFIMMASQIKSNFESKNQIPPDPHDTIYLDKKVEVNNSCCCCCCCCCCC